MDYFIDDLLSSSKRSSSKSRTTSAGPSSPPLPPAPTLTRRKKSKSVKFPENPNTSAGQDSKAPTVLPAEAAAVPLPATPAPPSVELPSDEVPKVTSPEAIAVVTGPTQADYFSVAAPPEAQNLLTIPGAPAEAKKGDPAFFTPSLELPLPVSEMSQSEAEVPVVEDEPVEVTDKKDEPRVIEPGSLSEVEAANHETEDPTAMKEIPTNRAESPPPVLHLSQSPIAVVHGQPAILIGISGSPASGKTTVAHLLSLALGPTVPCFLIHQNDFSNPKHLLVPQDGDELGLDSRNTINFSLFKKVLEYAKREGRLPPNYLSEEPEANAAHALSQIDAALLESLQDRLLHMPAFQDGRPVGIVEGPYLYQSETVRDLLDVKIFLRTSKSVARRRCLEKTNEPGAGLGTEYWDFADNFERKVWHNHAREHEILFEHGDIESRPNQRFCRKVAISVQPAIDMDLIETLGWIIDQVEESCKQGHEHEDSRIEFEFEACDCSHGLLGKIRKTLFDLL
ncbi:MAG: hypothetical protein Q9174_002851 [Haloplaca sp. 1 TL-2023]